MASGSGAIRAGRAFVELFTDSNALYRGLEDAKRRLQSWGKGIAKLGAGIGGAGAAAGVPLLGMFKQATDRGAAIDMLGKRLNASAEDVSALQFAFERGGVGIEEFGGVLTGLQQRFSNAADSGDEMLRRLGLNDRGMLSLPLTKQLDLLADAVNRVNNPTDKARVAQDLFGESGLRMLDVLKKGSAGLKEQTEAAKAFGMVISQADAAKATATTKAWVDIQLALKSVVLETGMAILGYSGDVVGLKDRVIEVAAEVRAWIKENRGWVIGIAAAAAGAVALGAAFVGLGAVVTGAGAVIGAVVLALKLAFAALAGIVGAVLSPVGLVTAAVVGIGVAIASQTEAGEGFFGRLKGGAIEFADVTKEAWGGISEAIAKGDFAAAAKIAWTTLKSLWASVVRWLTEQWVAIKSPIVDTWYEIVDRIKQGIADLKGAFGGFADGVKGVFATLYDATIQPYIDAVKALSKAVDDEAARHAGQVDAAGKARTQGGGYKIVTFEVDPTGRTGLAQIARGAELAAAELKKFNAEMERLQALREPFAHLYGRGDGETSGLDEEKDLIHLQMQREARQRELMEQMKMATPASSVKGSFVVTSASQQFGYDDTVAKRQLVGIEKIAENAVSLPGIKEAMMDIGRGLRLK